MSPKSSLEVMGSLNTAIDKWPLLQISYSSGGESYHWKFGQLAKFHGYAPNVFDVLIFIENSTYILRYDKYRKKYINCSFFHLRFITFMMIVATCTTTPYSPLPFNA